MSRTVNMFDIESSTESLEKWVLLKNPEQVKPNADVDWDLERFQTESSTAGYTDLSDDISVIGENGPDDAKEFEEQTKPQTTAQSTTKPIIQPSTQPIKRLTTQLTNQFITQRTFEPLSKANSTTLSTTQATAKPTTQPKKIICLEDENATKNISEIKPRKKSSTNTEFPRKLFRFACFLTIPMLTSIMSLYLTEIMKTHDEIKQLKNAACEQLNVLSTKMEQLQQQINTMEEVIARSIKDANISSDERSGGNRVSEKLAGIILEHDEGIENSTAQNMIKLFEEAGNVLNNHLLETIFLCCACLTLILLTSMFVLVIIPERLEKKRKAFKMATEEMEKMISFN